MQLLEQLALGYQEVTEIDILTECAEINGYLECMREMNNLDIVAENVLMEGVNFKEIISRAFTALQGIFERISNFLKKIVRFFRRKGNGLSSSTNTGSSKGSVPPGDSNNSSAGNVQEEIRAILNETDFIGIYPLDFSYSSPYLIEMAYSIILINIRYVANYIMKRTEVEGIKKILKRKERGSEYASSMMMGVTDQDLYEWIENWAKNPDILIKKLKTVREDVDETLVSVNAPVDFNKIPYLILKNDLTKIAYQGLGVYKNWWFDSKTKLNINEYSKLFEYTQSAKKAYEKTRGEVAKATKEADDNMQTCIKLCNEMKNVVSKEHDGADASVVALMSNCVKAMQEVATICSVCITNLGSGMVGFMGEIDKQFANIDTYQKTVDPKINAVLKKYGYSKISDVLSFHNI